MGYPLFHDPTKVVDYWTRLQNAYSWTTDPSLLLLLL
jgi:hypothetical protein